MIEKITHFGGMNMTKSLLDSGFRRNDGVVVVSVDERERSYHEAFLNGRAVFIIFTLETAEPSKFSPAEPVV